MFVVDLANPGIAKGMRIITQRGKGTNWASYRFSVELNGISMSRYLDQNQQFTPWAQSMVIQVCFLILLVVSKFAHDYSFSTMRRRPLEEDDLLSLLITAV